MGHRIVSYQVGLPWQLATTETWNKKIGWITKIDIIPKSIMCYYLHRTTIDMNVSLTSNLEEMVKGLVKSGRYNSASEVVRDGLRLVEEREELHQLKLQGLKDAIQAGLDSGPAASWDVEEFNRRARKRRSVKSST